MRNVYAWMHVYVWKFMDAKKAQSHIHLSTKNIIVDVRCHCNKNKVYTDRDTHTHTQTRSADFSYEHTIARTHGRTGNPIICYIWLPLIHEIKFTMKIFARLCLQSCLNSTPHLLHTHCAAQIIFWYRYIYTFFCLLYKREEKNLISTHKFSNLSIIYNVIY